MRRLRSVQTDTVIRTGNRGIANIVSGRHTCDMTANSGERGNQLPATDSPPTRQGDIPADTFAARLVLARHHAGRLSIEKAAEKCGLNSGNWVRWEDGALPRDKVEVAQAISDGLGIDFHWLLLGGPLLSGRGRVTRRTSTNNVGYRRRPLRPTPVGVYGRARARGTAPRIGRTMDRSQPVAGQVPPALPVLVDAA